MKEKTGTTANHVQSLERAFAIIEMLSLHRELGIAELSDLVNLDRSTVHRLLATMKHLGYINQKKSNLKYQNSLKFFEIGNNVVRHIGLNEIADPFMRQLSKKTCEGVNLAVQSSNSVVYVHKIDSPATIRVDLVLGAYMPLHCTGLGKILLAHMSEEKICHLLFSDTDDRTLKEKRLKAYTPHTLVTFDVLWEELQAVKSNGYSIDNSEYIEGLYCLAAPVYDHSGTTTAALSVAFPNIVGMDLSEKKAFILPALLETASQISKALGFDEKAL